MAEKPLFLHSVVKLLGGMALASGLAACSVQSGHDLTQNLSPKGRYDVEVMREVKKKWDHNMVSLSGSRTRYGSLGVVFYVNQKGKVEDLQVTVEKYTNPAFTAVTLKSIREAKFPPMSAAVVAALPKTDQGRLRVFYDAINLPSKPDTSAKGRYVNQVREAVKTKWQAYCQMYRPVLSPGTIQMEYYVTSQGNVEEIRVINDKKSSPLLTQFTLRALTDATIPPMPADVLRSLPVNDRGRVKTDFEAVVVSSKSRSETKGTPPPAAQHPANENSPKGRYIRKVLGEVEKKWHIYRQLHGKDVSAGSLEIEFYVNKQGKVESLRVVNDKGSYPTLTKFTLQAVQYAEIPPMPADVIPLLPKSSPERLKIEYNVLIY